MMEKHKKIKEIIVIQIMVAVAVVRAIVVEEDAEDATEEEATIVSI
jgi:hypothetical protein